MKQSKAMKILIGAILAGAFLIQGPFRPTVLTLFSSVFSTMGYIGNFLINNGIAYIAFFACMYLLFKEIKWSAALAAGLLVIDVIGDLLSFLPVLSIVYQIIRPLLVVALLLAVFYWITKKKVVFSKPLLIAGICLLGTNVVLTIVDHIYYMILLNSFINIDMMNFLQLMSAADNIFSILAIGSFYGLAFVMFWLMLKSQGGEQDET